VAEQLRSRGVDRWSGFVWSKHQEAKIIGRGVPYESLVVFTRDLFPAIDEGPPPDLEWLAKRERELGVSIQRMLSAERHMLAGRSYEQIARMAEVALRRIAAAYDAFKPDFIFSEDVSCFHSYAHFALARERGIPFWCISTGRLPDRVSVYSSGFQHYEKFERVLRELEQRGLDTRERRDADAYLTEFAERPSRPSGMKKRAKRVGIELADLGRLRNVAASFFGDPDNPTAVPPLRAIQTRVTRLARIASAEAVGVFEPPVAGEKYVLYPLHYQPEATTLVQAPLYVDQLALLRDMAVSLPAGYRLYIKEHMSSRGRRPLAFYNAIRDIPAARLLGPDEDTWALIRGASAIAVITGTMGWEGLFFEKPVITFGDVFFNLHPSVYQAARIPKDGWYAMFQRALTDHHHDREALLRMISALQQTSYPGFMGSPYTFPEIAEPENVARITEALSREIGLPAPAEQR
jgi:hypothetical protein